MIQTTPREMIDHCKDHFVYKGNILLVFEDGKSRNYKFIENMKKKKIATVVILMYKLTIKVKFEVFMNGSCHFKI